MSFDGNDMTVETFKRLNILTARKCDGSGVIIWNSVFFVQGDCFFMSFAHSNHSFLIFQFLLSIQFCESDLRCFMFFLVVCLFASNKQWADSKSLHPILRCWTERLVCFSSFLAL